MPSHLGKHEILGEFGRSELMYPSGFGPRHALWLRRYSERHSGLDCRDMDIHIYSVNLKT